MVSIQRMQCFYSAKSPARCVQTFRIEDSSRPDFVVVPGVVNCFICVIYPVDNASLSWIIENGKASLPLQSGMLASIANGTTTVEVEGNTLILPMPELYVRPGIVGRKFIICSQHGQEYEARLVSPGIIL